MSSSTEKSSSGGVSFSIDQVTQRKHSGPTWSCCIREKAIVFEKPEPCKLGLDRIGRVVVICESPFIWKRSVNMKRQHPSQQHSMIFCRLSGRLSYEKKVKFSEEAIDAIADKRMKRSSINHSCCFLSRGRTRKPHNHERSTRREAFANCWVEG